MTGIDHMVDGIRFTVTCIEDLHARMVEVTQLLEEEQSHVGNFLGLSSLARYLSSTLTTLDGFHQRLTTVNNTLLEAVARLESAKGVSSVEDALRLLGANQIGLGMAQLQLAAVSEPLSGSYFAQLHLATPRQLRAEKIRAVVDGTADLLREANAALVKAMRDNDDGTAGVSGA